MTKNVIVVGYGNRGEAYTKYAEVNPEKLSVIGVCEPNDFRRNEAKRIFGIKDENCFISVEDCIKKGKFADAVIDTTMDTLHIKTAIPFLELGYDMLLEKPITNNSKELLNLRKIAQENGCKLMICHVLRYTPFYRTIKEIVLSGEIGEIVHMETSEMVGVAHYSSSYVRGKWKNKEECGSSMLLAKCCHDLDLLCWFNGKKPIKVSSLGGRHFFLPENAPKGSGTRCLKDCPLEKDCIYSAKKMYIENDAFPFYTWSQFDKNPSEITYEEKVESLKTNNPCGECIFKTGANIVDRQTLCVEFENGATAVHSMVGSVSRPARKIHIVGTLGEIEGCLESNKFVVRTYNANNLMYNEREICLNGIDEKDGHAGGDSRLVDDFVHMLCGDKPSISSTNIDDSINGHLCVYSADESMESGKVIMVEKY